MAWDFKGEESNSHGDEKANFGKKKKKKKKKFAGPATDNGKQNGL